MSENTGRLDAIQARLAAATPGPWHLDRDESGEVPSVVAYAHNDGITIGTYVADTVEEDGDAEFIAAAPSDVAFLLAELRKRDEAEAAAWQMGYSKGYQKAWQEAKEMVAKS